MLKRLKLGSRRDHRGQDRRARRADAAAAQSARAAFQPAGERSAPRRRAHHAALFELRRCRRIPLAPSRLAEGARRRALRAPCPSPMAPSFRCAATRMWSALPDRCASAAWCGSRRRRTPRPRLPGREARARRPEIAAPPCDGRRGARAAPPARLAEAAGASRSQDARRSSCGSPRSRAEAHRRARPDHALGIVLDDRRSVLLLAARARAALRARLSRRA